VHVDDVPSNRDRLGEDPFGPGSGLRRVRAVTSAPAAPARVLGRYAVYDRLASGGMATLHLGRLLGPLGFARTVVVKQPHARYAADQESASMFLDEARLAARNRHPNVVTTIDVVSDAGELFLVLEYVPGESLVRLLRTVMGANGRVPTPVAAALMAGVLHGLHAAHEATDDHGKPLGIVHRDVSPQNVLVGTDGVARVLDFGIMKAPGGERATTDSGTLRGKAAYLPPERLRGEDVSRRSDVYSAGVVLWEIVAGRRLFPSDFADASEKILAGVSEPPSLHTRVGVKTLTTVEMTQLEALDAIVMRAVHLNPVERYPTARAMALALEASGPLAPQSTVGLWVESLAKTALEERAALVRAIEERSASRSRAGAPRPAAPALPPAPRTSRRRLLAAGDAAPDIDRVTTRGERFVLSKSTRPCTVLYFFPRAFSPFCTREARLFRDIYAELALAGADVIGISTDDHETQCAFVASLSAKYPMIADADRAISRAYGVLWPVLGRAKRVTFVVDGRMKILATFRHELRIKTHRDHVLRFVDALYRARQA
jgi:serine/threonine protein kinase/peroxiredoxin